MRYFTVEEANRFLPRVQRLAAPLVAAHDQIITLRPQVAGVLEKSGSDSGSAAASQMYLAFVRFETMLAAIQALGVEVKDPATALCDFPALHEGRTIYLCWRLGEGEVEWWHELHTGFAGRRHVNELL